MNPPNASIKIGGAGLLPALLASSCCIVPFIALITGSSGITSSFSWAEPMRPYLIALSISALSFTWYQKLRKNKTADDCCASVQKAAFIQSKPFLGIITILAIAMMAFPLYSNQLLGNNEKMNPIIDESNMNRVEFTISGMTCTGCETHIKHAVENLQGVASVNVSYENSNATVSYDAKQTTLEEIREAIGSTGYGITNTE